jgi:hypothetical protein
MRVLLKKSTSGFKRIAAEETQDMNIAGYPRPELLRFWLY